MEISLGTIPIIWFQTCKKDLPNSNQVSFGDLYFLWRITSIMVCVCVCLENIGVGVGVSGSGSGSGSGTVDGM